MKEQLIRKVTGGLLTCALMFGVAPVEAGFDLCCINKCEHTKYYVAAAAQYYFPGNTDTRYAVAGATDLNAAGDNASFAKQNDQYIKTGGSWGFKVLGGVDYEWISFQGTYERWTNEQVESVVRGTGQGAFVTVPGAAGNWRRVRGRQELTNQKATLWASIPVCTACYWITALNFVATYVDLEQELTINAANPILAGVEQGSVGLGRANSRFRGGGIGFGISQESPLPIEGWWLGGYFHFDGLVGESAANVSQFRVIPVVGATPGQDLTLRQRSQAYWIPHVESAFVFGYTYDCACVRIKARAGWIWNIYFNALFDAPTEGFTSRGVPIGVNQAPNQLRESAFKTLSYGGPVIYLGAIF